MYTINWNIRSVVMLTMLSSTVMGIGQATLFAEFNSLIEVQTESTAEPIEDAIIVDANSSVKSYPSMEEEMEMYVELRSKLPRAFFFPNPSTGVIWIEHNLGSGTSVEIKEMSGQVIYKANEMSARKLDLAELPQGSYSIQLVLGDRRLIKELEVR